jgi:hypothetical protein
VSLRWTKQEICGRLLDHLSVSLRFFFKWLFQPIQGPGLLFSSVIVLSQTAGLHGRVISPSQDRYLNTGQHKQNKRIHTPNIHTLSGIRTDDPRVRATEDSSCLRPRGYRDRLKFISRPNYILKLLNDILCFLKRAVLNMTGASGLTRHLPPSKDSCKR